MSAISCQNCFAVVDDHAQFCSTCGTFLSLHSDHPTQFIDSFGQDALTVEREVTSPLESATATYVADAGASSDPGATIPAGEGWLAAGSRTGFAGPAGRNEGSQIASMSSGPTVSSPHWESMEPATAEKVALSDQATSVSPANYTPTAWAYKASGQPESRAMRLPQTVLVNHPPAQHSRPGAIGVGKNKRRNILASGRYFVIGTGILLLIGIATFIAYPYILGTRTTTTSTAAPYVQQIPTQTPAVQNGAVSNPTPAAAAMPTVTQAATPTTTANTNTGLTAATATPTVQPTTTTSCLLVSHSTLNYNATVGGTAPTPQVITLTNNCATAWTTRWDVSWLSANPGGGNAYGPVKVAINVSSANLTANTYTGHIVFSTGASQAQVTVNLTVAQPARVITPCIKVNQTSLSFSGTSQQRPAPQSILVTNCGSAGTVTTAVVHNGGTSWLTTPGGGQLAEGNALAIHVMADSVTQPLKPGVYTSSLTITITTSDGKVASQTVNVTLSVQPAAQASQSQG